MVSVIIPCYNGALVIDRSIESVYIQDYAIVELIVVDDGSTDDSKERIQSWAEKFESKGWILKYVYQENRGLGGAIDTGLKHVTGGYLTLLDADDYFLPGSIFKRAAFLDERPEYAGVRTNGWMIRGKTKRLFITSETEKRVTDLFSALIFGQTNNWAGSYMVRTDILFGFYPDRNIYPSRFGQNMQILLPVSYKRKFGYIDEPLMAYIVHNGSLSQADSEEAQFHRDEVNAQGYRDIYTHMLTLIIKDQKEYSRYSLAYDASFYRCAMQRAAKYDKLKHLEQNYRMLSTTGHISLNDRILYYQSKKSPIAIVLRIIRKCKSVLEIGR